MDLQDVDKTISIEIQRIGDRINSGEEVSEKINAILTEMTDEECDQLDEILENHRQLLLGHPEGPQMIVLALEQVFMLGWRAKETYDLERRMNGPTDDSDRPR